MSQATFQVLQKATEWVLLLLLTLVLITPAAIAASPASASVTNGQGEFKNVSGRVTVDAPVDAVWQTITSYNDLKNYVPGYQESRILQANGNAKTVQIGVKVSKFLPVMKYQVKINETKPAYQVNIQRISGDFKAITASYKLIPSANGVQTTIVYNLQIALGDKIPNIGVSSTLKHSTEETLTAIQSRSTSVYKKSVLANK